MGMFFKVLSLSKIIFFDRVVMEYYAKKKLLCKMINYQEFFSKTKNTSPYIETTSEAALKEFYAMLVGGAQQSFHGSWVHCLVKESFIYTYFVLISENLVYLYSINNACLLTLSGAKNAKILTENST